jgi:hypothetical protein
MSEGNPIKDNEFSLFKTAPDDVQMPTVHSKAEIIEKAKQQEQAALDKTEVPDFNNLPTHNHPPVTMDLTDEHVSLKDTIMGEKVKTVLIKEETDIYPYNYVLDFSDLDSINSIQKDALKALVTKDGDIKLYLFKKNTGLTAFGMGDKYKLESLMPLIKQYVFADSIKVYKNFSMTEDPQEVKSRDITKLRMNL